MKKRKICVITGTRAEYGLLYWLMQEIKQDKSLELQVIATGMHLSPEFGLTFKEIEKDGLAITKKIEILLSSDTPAGISKSMGLAMIGMADAFEELSPDIIVLLGDRFEILSAAAAATVSRIPIAHISGGESTLGAMDEAFRHSITKMAQLHFPSTEIYRKRIIQLGENPENIFNVGATGVDNIKKLKLLNKAEFEQSINFKLNKKNLLVTFHPVTLEKASAENQFNELLLALESLKDTNIIFTMPNSDTDGRVLIKMIEGYVNKHKENTAAYTSLGQLRYLSCLQFMDAMVGNSSSGIIEAPLFKIPTINIGDRQTGRIMSESIINCAPEKESIKAAIEKAYNPNFREKIKTLPHPYGEGGAAIKIKEILKNASLENILKKKFYDIDFQIK